MDDRLREDVAFLADSARLGRGFGSRGAQDAAFYIIRRFKDAGLQVRVQSFSSNHGVGHNVIAEMRGNHGSDRWVMVCAYYDGLGELSGKVYPCADSNASGVAALLHLATSMTRSGLNVLFVALDGHNDGLSGADAVCSLRQYKVSLVVNLDTVGSILAPPVRYNKEYLIALGTTQQQRTWLEKENSGLKLDLHYDYYGSRQFTEMFYSRISDLRPFVARGIPSVMFTSGITMNTNKAADDAAALNYIVFAKRVELIRRWLCRQR